ncbi:MAG: DUF1573 domain-containing protein [Bacteroidetes bacterium]|nr:DUF1573 domain-containing protein [Bacteroidota bacterium]
MKQLVFALFCTMLCAGACRAQQPAVSTPAPFVQWEQKKIDLGKVKKGEKRNLFFTFTNTSGADAQIELVDACTCTTTDYPRGIIPPGGKARIDATFDSTEKDESETIDINVLFKQTDAKGIPHMEIVQYAFDLVK